MLFRFVEIDEPSIAEHNKKKPDKKIEIKPGMTALVEVKTGTQTVMHYLTKPLNKTFSGSLRER